VVKRDLGTAAGGLPVVLWCLGLVGMLWADVSWHDRFACLGGFHRLLAVPLLLAQFRRSENGIWVIRGFFASSIALLIASYAIVVVFGTHWPGCLWRAGARHDFPRRRLSDLRGPI